MVNAALRLAYSSYASVAVLISQRVIGIKSFQEQIDPMKATLHAAT